MKVVSKMPITDIKQKTLPMHKDPVYLAKLRLEFIAAHNEKIRKQRS